MGLASYYATDQSRGYQVVKNILAKITQEHGVMIVGLLIIIQLLKQDISRVILIFKES